jgi:hypothetical protein
MGECSGNKHQSKRTGQQQRQRFHGVLQKGAKITID